MHLTLINLDKLLANQKDIDWQLLGSHISEHTSELPVLEFQIAGINVFPTTLFAEIYDQTGLLEMYRRAIIEGVGSYLSTSLNPNDYNALVPGVTFTNVIRFKDIPDPSVVESVARMRTLNIGAFTPTTFELVTTNKLLSSERTVTNAIVRMQQ